MQFSRIVGRLQLIWFCTQSGQHITNCNREKIYNILVKRYYEWLSASRGLKISPDPLQLKLTGTSKYNINDNDMSIGGDNEDDDSLDDVTNDNIENLPTISEENGKEVTAMISYIKK